MKTTVEIPDAVLKAARKLAAPEGTTLRALIEQGLRQVISARKTNSLKKPFRFRPIVFKGEGLQPGLKDASWDEIRDLIYDRRGDGR